MTPDDPRARALEDWFWATEQLPGDEDNPLTEGLASIDAADRAAGFLRVRPADPDLIERIAKVLDPTAWDESYVMPAFVTDRAKVQDNWRTGARDQARAVLSALEEDQ